MAAAVNDDDRKRRLRDLESKIQDLRSIINVDCLLDTAQALVNDCDHPAIRKIKNIDAFVQRCEDSTLDLIKIFQFIILIP